VIAAWTPAGHPDACDVARSREYGRPIGLTRLDALRYAAIDHRAAIADACARARGFMPSALPHVPGATMAVRMAERIGLAGLSPERAAAREYVYRWTLALIPSPRNAGLFGVPHALGLDGVDA
jgi:hypothetical protein